jgi:hypothetical protein
MSITTSASSISQNLPGSEVISTFHELEASAPTRTVSVLSYNDTIDSPFTELRTNLPMSVARGVDDAGFCVSVIDRQHTVRDAIAELPSNEASPIYSLGRRLHITDVRPANAPPHPIPSFRAYVRTTNASRIIVQPPVSCTAEYACLAASDG